MDRYQFPHITHISQCLEAIKGCEAFHVAERDRHTIINYHQMGTDVFPPVSTHPEWTKMIVPDGEKYFTVNSGNGNRYYRREPDVDYMAAIRRECRGIVFGPDGKVIARRLHKFFNLGEREETALEKVNLAGNDHVILEKLDGSMITPIPIDDHIRWGTKMGLTEVGFQAEEFIAQQRNNAYVPMAKHCRDIGVTPIFEWCSRKQRIVVDYRWDGLYLLAVRNNVTGAYLGYQDMVNFAKFWQVPVVRQMAMVWRGNIGGLMEDMSVAETGSEHEGYVVRFDDGHAVKVKYPDYVRIHRVKDSISQEKRVVELVLNEKTDDVLPHLIDHDRKALSDFSDAFWRGLMETTDQITFVLGAWKEITKGDRKRFALEAQIDMKIKSVCFSLWDRPTLKKLVMDELIARVGKNLGSQTSIDGARWMWGGVRWSDFIQGADDVEGN